MSKPVHHTLDIYGTELHAAYDKRGWAALRRMHPSLEPPATLGYGQTNDTRTKSSDQQHVWLYIDVARHNGDAADLVDTIAHEATHAALFIAARHAIDPDAGNGEPLAYLVGWLTGWLLRNMPSV